MQRPRAITTRFLTFSALLLVALFAPSAFAQDAPKPQLYRVVEVHVKPEMVPAYMEFTKKETLPAYQKAGVKERAVWQSTLGAGFTFVSVEPLDGLAQLDGPNPIVKGLGEAGAQAWSEKWRRLIVSARTYLVTLRPDLSIAAKPNEMPKLGFVATTAVAPGRNADYVKWVKELVPILGKTNIKGIYVSATGAGGDPNEYTALLMFDSFADIEKFPALMNKAAAEAKYSGPLPAGIAVHTEYAVYRYVPELSISPQMAKAANQ